MKSYLNTIENKSKNRSFNNRFSRLRAGFRGFSRRVQISYNMPKPQQPPIFIYSGTRNNTFEMR